MLTRMITISLKCGVAGFVLLYLSKREIFQAKARFLDGECNIEKGELNLVVGNTIRVLRLSLRDGFRLSMIDIMSAKDLHKIKNTIIGGTVLAFLRLFFGTPVIKALEAAELTLLDKIEEIGEETEEAKSIKEQLQGILEARKLFGLNQS